MKRSMAFSKLPDASSNASEAEDSSASDVSLLALRLTAVRRSLPREVTLNENQSSFSFSDKVVIMFKRE